MTRRPPASPARLLETLALGAWAGLFWFLLISGRTAFYLSSRTSWVVVVGAVTLSLAVLGRLASLGSVHPETVSVGAAGGIALLILPVVVILVLPPAALGSYAAARRSTVVGAGFSASSGSIATGDLDLLEVAAAQRSREGMRALSARAGREVSFVGFVVRTPEMPPDEFLLSRFVVSCCAADALSTQVRVVGAPPGRLAADDWVRVEGHIYPLGREVIVDATSVSKVARPAHPYLTP
jgi:uncharacterized repeat protein (TIGR03943 family)